MPLYEYACKKCKKHVEKIESYKGPHLKACPSCGGPVERLMSAPAIQFKGQGWYVTDYGRSSGKHADGKDSGGKDTAANDSSQKQGDQSESTRGSNKSETKSDSKSDAKGPASAEKRKPVSKEK